MKSFCTISVFLLAGNLLAQPESVSPRQERVYLNQNQDVALLQQAFSLKPRQRLTEQFSLSRQNTNELQAVLSGLFLFYKSFLSSQDNQRCSFHPSCSEYGLEAVKKLGIIRGVLCTCDRLTRCNGFSPRQYEVDMEHRRLKDPVKW